jgi:hypothetical protein
MKIAMIYSGDGNITTIKEYTPVHSRGEIAHFLAELELIRMDLLQMWEEYDGD